MQLQQTLDQNQDLDQVQQETNSIVYKKSICMLYAYAFIKNKQQNKEFGKSNEAFYELKKGKKWTYSYT